MKNFAIFIILMTSITSLTHAKSAGASYNGSQSVKGHFKKGDTYVQPHHATNPNSTQKHNWTSKPNVNPYTGKQGNKEAGK